MNYGTLTWGFVKVKIDTRLGYSNLNWKWYWSNRQIKLEIFIPLHKAYYDTLLFTSYYNIPANLHHVFTACKFNEINKFDRRVLVLMTIGSARFLYGFEKRGNFEVPSSCHNIFVFRLSPLQIGHFWLLAESNAWI